VPTTPWIRIAPPAPGREYLALISFLPLRHFRAIPNFVRFTFQIQHQLKTSVGLIGYSLDAKPFSRKFWTLSVWEGQQPLNDFVRQIPHRQVMQAMAPHMGRTQFAQWTVTNVDIPLDWPTAKARLSQS